MLHRPAPAGSHCNDCICHPQCLLGRLDAATQAAWRPHLAERRFRKGEVLQHQGESARCVQVIKVGTLLVQRRGDDGVNYPVGMTGCCEALAAPALLEQPAGLSYLALTPGRMCELHLPPLHDGAPAPQGLLLELAREQLLAATRLADWGRIARIPGVTGQMAGALLLLADLQRSTLVRLPSHTVLAALLATTRESVARALAQLVRQGGVLRRDRWHVDIQRQPLLELARGSRRSAANLHRARHAANDSADAANSADSAAAAPLRARKS